MASKPQPFTLAVPEQAIADLRDRLARTRLPDQAPIPPGGDPWAFGTNVAYLADLVDALAGRLRLARPGGRAQRLPAVHGAAARHRPALPARAGAGAEPDAAAADAWLARLGLRVPRHHPAADRPGGASAAIRRMPSPSSRRRCPATACPSRRGSRASASTTSPPPRRADDRRAGLPALCRAGRRLGRLRSPPASARRMPTR